MSDPKPISERPYSPIHRRMLDVLGDGQHHTKQELHACCGPQGTSQSSTVDAHLTYLRKKLLRESSNGHRITIIPIHEAEDHTFQLVLIRPATLKDLKSLG